MRSCRTWTNTQFKNIPKNQWGGELNPQNLRMSIPVANYGPVHAYKPQKLKCTCMCCGNAPCSCSVISELDCECYYLKSVDIWHYNWLLSLDPSSLILTMKHFWISLCELPPPPPWGLRSLCRLAYSAVGPAPGTWCNKYINAPLIHHGCGWLRLCC